MPIGPSGGSGAGGLTSLFTSTLSGAAASIDTGAGGIAAGHGTLLVVFYGRTSAVSVDPGVNVTFNNDGGANYDLQLITGSNVTASAVKSQAATSLVLDTVGTNAGDSYATSLYFVIPAYDQTTFWKSGIVLEGFPYSQTTAQTAATAAIGYRSTTAISRMKVAAGSGNLAAGTILTVYGTQ